MALPARIRRRLLICFALVFLVVRAGGKHDLASGTIYGMAAAMTNTGFVALPILHAIYGQPAVLPAAVATVFVAAVMFPITVILLEKDVREPAHPAGLVKQILLNPMVLSTLIGLVWAITGLPIPAPVAAYLNMIADALTPCALFAIGLGLSVEGLRSNLKASFALAAVKLVVMPLIVYGLCVVLVLDPLYTVAASRLRGRADRKDRVCPRARAQGRGETGCGHGLDHDDAVGRDIAGRALFALRLGERHALIGHRRPSRRNVIYRVVLFQVGTELVTPTEGQLYEPTDGAVTVPDVCPDDP